MTKHLLLAALALVALPSSATGSEHTDDRALLVILNGREFPGADDELPFYPGRPNVLEFQLRWHRIDAGTVTVKVKRTTPDGREDVLTDDVPRGRKTFFTLGPLAAPPVYLYEAGEVLYRGYQLVVEVVDPESGATIDRQPFYQGLAKDGITPERLFGHKQARIRNYNINYMPTAMSPERLIAGEMPRQVFNPVYGVEPALVLKLAPKVLQDVDALEVISRLTPGVTPKLYHEPLPCRLVVRDSNGTTRFQMELETQTPGTWTTTPIDPHAWPEGDYEIALEPIIAPYRQSANQSVWRDGPTLTYRRRLPEANTLRISPLAPWTLERDPSRETVEIRDFEAAAGKWSKGIPDGWELEPRGSGDVRLVAPAGVMPAPLVLRPGLQGHYAVLARPAEEGCLLQVREEGLVRPVHSRPFGWSEPGSENDPPMFVVAADLTDASISIYAFHPWNDPASGLRRLQFVPVTRESVESLYRETSNPPRTLYGVNDWCDYFHGPCRLEADQFDMLVGGQAEVGLRHLNWSLGRSWIEYKSELPGVTYFPAVPLEEANKKWPHAMGYVGRATMINEFRPLQRVLKERKRLGATIWPWLSMNRHYGEHAYGGMFASRFVREHPQWHAYAKEGHPWGSQVSFFFPEVRKERLDIRLEVASKSPDGLLVGTCRQVPMLRYHPEMIEAYMKGITWRADHFTQVLRDLKKGLEAIRKKTDRRIPVAVRIPSSGLFYNMAEGLDIVRWLEEGLVDQLQLDPLHERGDEGSHDVRPYVALGKKYGVKVFGGIGATWTYHKALVPVLRRAQGLLAAGVDGIEIYETNYMARTGSFRWIVPLFGNPQRLDEFFANSNIPACYPVSAATAAYGYDGHSDWHRNNRGLPGL
jgi:hypothetical protein